MQDKSRYPVLNLHDGVFFKHYYRAEVQTPQHEIPARAVPESGKEPHDQYIQRLVTAVSAHRNVDVIPEETAQRDVPSPPEFRNGAGHVWVIEVLVKVESHAAPHADSHVGIAGKIEVDLHGVRQNAYPGSAGGKRSEVSVEERSRKLPELICENYLFSKSDKKPE